MNMRVKKFMSDVRRIAPIAVLGFMIAAAGCSNSNEPTFVEGKVNVVTTFYPIYDFVMKIGGEHVNVVNLVPTGVEPHDWTPKAKDMMNITDADMFIYNGADFEGWVHDFLDTLKKDSGPEVVIASQGIPLIETSEDEHADEEHADEEHVDEEHADEHDHEHGDVDPHVWLSPKQAMIMASNIKNALIDADAEHASEYTANYNALINKLQDLDVELTRITEKSTKKEFVVSHESFGYIARDYGLTQVGVMGLSADAEPTVKRMQEIKMFVEEHQIKYILFEELVSSKLAETLAKSLHIETMVLNPLEGLTEEQVKAGEDYFSVMKLNLTTIEKALQ